MQPLIFVFVADLMFQTRIESVIKKLGHRVRLVENAGQMLSTDLEGQQTLGPEGILVDQLSRLGPGLLIFDLGNAEIPWAQWIPILKTNPATRRIPVICYGSHVDVDTLKAAKQTGANEVLARSRFVTAMPELIQKHVLYLDTEEQIKFCGDALHPDAIKGIGLFNQGDYFAAHEELEEAWKDDLSKGRDLYRGILQIAVAYYQTSRGNFNGALKMFQRARQWLDPLPDHCRGVDIAQLRKDAYTVHDEILALGSDHIGEFRVENFKPVRWNLKI